MADFPLTTLDDPLPGLPSYCTAEDGEQGTLTGDSIHGRCSVNVVQLVEKCMKDVDSMIMSH